MNIRKVGEVAMILGDKFAVIKSTQPLILGSEVSVYKEVSAAPEAASKYSIDKIALPKGKLRVLLMQADNLYLVSVITKRAAVQNPDNESLAKALSLYNSIFAKKQQENDSLAGEPAGYSAKLDSSKGINVDFNILVVPGDMVAIETAQQQ